MINLIFLKPLFFNFTKISFIDRIEYIRWGLAALENIKSFDDDVLDINPFMIRIGNGASEFIDILSRLWEPGTTWRPYPTTTQYLEFERAFTNAELVKVACDDASAKITIIVNPNSVTGDFYELSELREIIKRDSQSTFIIDESFIMCYGPNW